jgi:RimJ/RimL family protein N-acetyltransferase
MLEIKNLQLVNIAHLCNIFNQSVIEYNQYFIPFQFEYKVFKQILLQKKRDLYFGIFFNNVIIGFYMLRGFDEGFAIPSYGVWISKDFSTNGLAKLTMYHALCICKLLKVKEIMLKVHPENVIAKRIYENFGFTFSHVDQKIHHLVYLKSLF